MFCHDPEPSINRFSPKIAFLVVSFFLGQLGDGLNIFQGIYLVGIGWNEGSVGLALSLMGLTALIVQPWAGDMIDKTTFDRRIFLVAASILTASSASAIMFVKEGNTDHLLIFITKIIEGVSSSFIAPCMAALTLATFGPNHFDKIMASNILWGHIGSVVAAMLAGLVAYTFYPEIKLCFIVIGVSALIATFFVQYLPQGDLLMGRGFQGSIAMNEKGHLESIESNASTPVVNNLEKKPVSYWVIFSDVKTCIICSIGFFFHFANANVLLVLGELMGGERGEGTRSAIPLTSGAIITAQVIMAIATLAGDRMTSLGIGRKPLLMAGLASLPLRCALIILWKDSGNSWLLSTQVLDGIGGGLFGLIHPYLVADISFGTGRFSVLMGLTASFFGLGATLSNFLGQVVVEKFGHVASLEASLMISLFPVILCTLMPETYGRRGDNHHAIELKTTGDSTEYKEMA